MSVIRASIRDSALRLVLSNAKKRNPLSKQALDELSDGLKLASDEQCRVVVISAEGPVFSAGHDLKELRSLDTEGQHQLFLRCGLIMNSFRQLRVPVIAQVNGLAAAAGCQLVAACDMAVSGPSAKFSLPGAGVGLFCSAPSVPVLRNVSSKGAAYMLYTGNNIDAEQALTYGLISHKAASDSEAEELVEKIVKDIAAKPKNVIALGKSFLQGNVIEEEKARYAEAAKVMQNNLALDNGKEGLDAFCDKRHPKWE